MVKPVEPPSSTALTQEQERSLEKKQAEIEQRVWQRLQVELQNSQSGQTTELSKAMPSSRPPNSPRMQSSEQQSSTSAQKKAGWTSGTLNAMAAVPNQDARPLTHSELEMDLTEKVLAGQPDRTSLGYNEIIMR